jgi:molybdenum cofactor cytidylyltransferase
MGMDVVVNEQPERGMGFSIACGIGASQHASSWLIALADMPYIKVSTLEQLVDRLTDDADMVAPVYQQQRGHPVGFNYRYKDELLALDGDVGARHIIQKFNNQLELIPCEDAGVITDIDEVSDTTKRSP